MDSRSRTPIAPPIARVEPATDAYFGEKVTDPYRWMENDQDRDWRPYLEAQNAHTRAVLDNLPGRDALLERIQALSGALPTVAEVQLAGRCLFYEQRPAGANNFKLFVRESGQDRLLIDPTTYDTDGHHVSLDWWEAAPDGSKVAFGLSQDGSEDSTLHVVETATGRVLPERIPQAEGANPQWVPDGTGFFYNQLTGAVGSPDRFLDSRARFHRLGTDPAADPVVMARGLDPRVVFDRIQMPYVYTFTTSADVILVLADVRTEARLFIANRADVLAGQARWRPVADFPDEITDFDLDGNVLYLLANRGHPRGRVLKVATQSPDLAGAVEVVPESALVLEDLNRAQDGLYIRAMDGGLGRLLRFGNDGKLSGIALPFDGTLGDIATDVDAPGAVLILSGWLTPTGVWTVDARGKVSDTGLTSKPSIDVSPYATERRFATARDGTRIPYDLVYRKDLERDGSNPAYISAYGSYGIPANTPRYLGRSLALVDQGAIVGYASVRGGGEYGRDWHRGGQLDNKPNTWRDLIAVCEDMIANGYTAPSHLAIGGRSAGGITVGRAMTERPDLFAAVVSGVGWHNPLRYVAEQNGYGEEPEWGAISTESGYRALRRIDSYHAVEDGANYPAVLLTTGVTDPRVSPFHAAKMAARLQAASASGRPILL
ncbi:MAG TPA: prolyl oligopeptidase family serine peptidase, partial [Steroidobacteraceae bacterium]|nr:prolyl oligopeptidase family serine peptidase [Steroidobacteraceae bacterium]